MLRLNSLMTCKHCTMILYQAFSDNSLPIVRNKTARFSEYLQERSASSEKAATLMLAFSSDKP